MDAQPNEEFSSNIPAERRKLGRGLLSEELFDIDELMEGPRKRAKYFNDILSEHFPQDRENNTEHTSKSQASKVINGQLNGYEDHWLKRHLTSINDEYRTIILSSPEAQPQKSELSFHTINQFIMPQWRRVLISPKFPKMDVLDLETAQIRLAVESAAILSARGDFQESELFKNELLDIDAMITLLQLSIDGELRGQPNIIAVPHPEIGNEHHQADFIIFKPDFDNSLIKTEVQTGDILNPALVPGSIAVNILKNLRISSISRRPEFQEKAAFHKLLFARESTRSFNQEVSQSATLLESTTKRIAQWLLNRYKNETEPPKEDSV